MVPAPSSTTTSSSPHWARSAISRLNVAKDGMMLPICSGVASHRLKKRNLLAVLRCSPMLAEMRGSLLPPGRL